MPTTEQISTRLFKKDLNTGDTSTARQFFEEPFSSGVLVKPDQILAQFNEVPGTAPVGMVNDEIIGVVQRKIDVVLTAIPGTTNSFQDDALKDAIPFNHGDGSYAYSIKDNLDNPIFFGQGDWIVDTVAGILIFYGTVPSNMPPKISFYKYVGSKGAGSQDYFIVADIIGRNDIPVDQRHDGTMCYVQSETDTYQLQGGITNNDWVNITKQAQAPENVVLGNNSSDSIILIDWSVKNSFILFYRAERGSNFESGEIRIDYYGGSAYYAETGGRLDNLGITIDINVDGSNLVLDWITTDNVDDANLTYIIGNIAYDTSGSAGDMLVAVYDPQGIAADAFNMDNMTDGVTNRLYTSAEKAKLAGLESSKYLGTFISLVALETAYPSPVAGSYGYVDTGVGSLVKKYIWDETDNQYVGQLSDEATETPATIKSKYESNPDTNAFTDAEQSKLGILPEGQWWHNINASARLWGGTITSNGDGTVAIAAGAGLIKTDDAGAEDVPTAINQGQASILSLVSWSAVASLTLIDNAYNFIYYDGDTGTIQATTDFYSISFTRDFTLGRGYRTGNSVIIRLCGTNLWNFNRRVQLFGEETFPVVRAKGMIIANEGTRHFSITSGILWAELVNRFSVSAFNSNTGGTFTTWYNNGAWISTAGQTQINNTQYNNYGVGLVALSNNQYGVHWVYEVHDSSVHVVFGRGSYTLAQAQAAQPPAQLPGLVASYATIIGKIIILQAAAELYSAESAFANTFISSGVTEHDNLAGLNVGDYQHLTSAQKTSLTTGINADVLHGHSADVIEIYPAAAHVRYLKGLMDHVWSIGTAKSGFDITDNGNGTINVTAGTAALRSTNDSYGELDIYAITGQTNIALTDNATNFILADYNSGTPQLLTSSDLNNVIGDVTKALIWIVNRLGTSLHIIDYRGSNADFIHRNSVKRYKISRVDHASGGFVSYVTGMQFSITAAEFYLVNVSLLLPAFTGGTDTYTRVYRNGSGGYTRVAGQNAVDYNHYDNGTGTLALLGNNQYGVHWVMARLGTNADIVVVYGRASYATLAAAQAVTMPSDFPSDLNALSTAVLIAKIITNEGIATAFSDIQSPFTDTLFSSNATTHNNLAGLQGGQSGEYYHLTAAEYARAISEKIIVGASTIVAPSNADWPITAGATIAADTNNAALMVAQFDDTIVEGVDLGVDGIKVPSFASTMRLNIEWRAETAPGAISTVGLGIYNRNLTAGTAWSSVAILNDLSVPTNENRQSTSIDIDLSGYTVGNTYQFELVRRTPQAGTNLSGDWDLFRIEIEFIP